MRENDVEREQGESPPKEAGEQGESPPKEAGEQGESPPKEAGGALGRRVSEAQYVTSAESVLIHL